MRRSPCTYSEMRTETGHRKGSGSKLIYKWSLNCSKKGKQHKKSISTLWKNYREKHAL